MRHLDLFSGIGGFAIAVEAVWPNSQHIFCDNDRYCQELLKLRFPNSKIYGDIKKIKFIADSDRLDILTGGFPCQPFSQAGKRRGTSDDRYLWPEMFRIIQLTKPRWVVAENVRGLFTMQGGLVFEQVYSDLENADYKVQPFIIPAVSVNAPHRRDRIWFVASHAKSERSRGRSSKECGIEKREMEQGESERREIWSESKRRACNIANSASRKSREQAEQKRWKDFKRRDWEGSWLEVAAELCGMDDGLPAELDEFELSKSRHRIERLKALGNAIVPQVAIEIMKAIKEADEVGNA